MLGYEKLITYFKVLAENHADIQHSETDKRFFQIELEEALNSEFELELDDISVIIPNVEWRPVDNGAHVRQEMKVMFFIMGYYEQGDHEEKEQVKIKTELIMRDFLNRMKSDSQNGEDLFFHSQDKFDVDSVLSTHLLTSKQSIGWQAIINISPHYNDCVDVDKWEDLS